jgi:hypothetical protein
MVKCNYDEHVQNELLRDRFVAGCSSDKIREKLLLEPDTLTLEQALVIANNVERVCIENKSVSGDDNSVRRIGVQARGKRNDRPVGRANGDKTGDVTCYACGKAGHKRGDPKCPAVGKQCKVCNGFNHFAAVCKKKLGQSEDSRQRAQSTVKGQQRQPASLQKQQPSSVSSVDVQVCTLLSCGKSKAIRCILNG